MMRLIVVNRDIYSYAFPIPALNPEEARSAVSKEGAASGSIRTLRALLTMRLIGTSD
jgi:hypothetical protein